MSRLSMSLSACVLVACASSHPFDPCPQVDEVMATQADLWRRTCGLTIACASDGDDVFSFSCTGLERPFDGARDYVCQALASGVFAYHPERVAPCRAALEAVEASGCRLPLPIAPQDVGDWLYPTVCDGVVELSSRDDTGVPCNDVCSADSRCLVTSTEGCGGTCVPLIGRGGACRNNAECAHGLHCTPEGRCDDTCTQSYPDCGFGSRYDICVGGHCEHHDHPVRGGACDPTRGPSPCLPGELPTFCDSGTHTCEWQARLGETCDPTRGAVCDGGACDAMTRVCVPTLCSPWEIPFFGCDAAHPYCGLDGHCVADPIGAACRGSLFGPPYAVCGPNGICDTRPTAGGTCRVPRSIGGACDPTVLCENGSTCSGGRCVRLARPGETCGSDNLCPTSDTLCIDGRCRETRIGDACGSDDQCARGVCRHSVCSWLAAGEPCIGAHSCEAGCDPAGSGSVCRAAPAGENERCAFDICTPGLTCVPRADGTAVCRRICPP